MANTPQRLIYSLLLYLAVPLILLRLLWRGRANPAYLQRVRERFGYVPAIRQGKTLWVHAVSVGEVQAALPLVRALQARYPDCRMVITTMTPTGAERVRSALGDSVEHCYAPYDLPDAIGRFLARVRPSLLVVMETELWPNLLYSCRRQGIPSVLVNARMSARSARGYARLAGLTRQTLACLSSIAAQTEQDARRLIELGADQAQVSVTGSLKFDLQVPDDLLPHGQALRAGWGAERPVWIAASTHEGEDEQILQAHRQILVQLPKALLILVPRHPERFDRVAALCTQQGLNTVRRSQGATDESHTQVYVGDTMGELLLLYAAADAAFIGGSLVSKGGQNPLEAAALGVPVISGPHMFNFSEISRLLQQAGASLQIQTSRELAHQVLRLLQDEELARQMGDNGRQLVAQHRGSLEQILRLPVFNL